MAIAILVLKLFTANLKIQETHEAPLFLESGHIFLYFQLAEKRKTILDEMAIKGQQSVTEQQKKMNEEEIRHKVSTTSA